MSKTPDAGTIFVDPMTPGTFTLNVQAKLTWVPAFPGDAPPQAIDVLESSKAFCTETPGFVGNASDGLGDIPVPGFDYPSTSGMVSTGSHLRHLVVPAGSLTVTLPECDLSESLTYVSGIPTSGFPGILSYSVQLDTREVTISANVDPTNMKTPDLNSDGSVRFDTYGNIVFKSVPHVATDDGTMYGDIGLPIDGPNAATTIEYNAVYHGSWQLMNSSYNWFSSLKLSGTGDGNPESGTLSDPDISNDLIPPFYVGYVDSWLTEPDKPGDLPGIHSVDAGKADHIHLTYVDGSGGATDTANYYMALHLPVETVPSLQPNKVVCRIATTTPVSGPNPQTGASDTPMTLDDPGYAAYNGPGITGTINPPPAEYAVEAAVTNVLSAVPYPPPFTGTEVLFTLLNMGITSITPQPERPVFNFTDAAWNDPWSTFPPDHPKSLGQPQGYYHMIPELRLNYKRVHIFNDIFDLHGFEGGYPASTDTYLGYGSTFGSFTWAGP